jgi:hypothetical protein
VLGVNPAKETVMRTPTALLTTAAVAVAVAGCATATTDDRSTLAASDLPPALPPASQFVRTVDNPWFPLEPGTVLTYKGNDEGTPATDVFRVTGRTKPILGIRATVIDDRVYHRGRLAERTNDWYAQDKGGNVWYLGESTATLKADGTVESTEGTWRAGVDGARAGIFMPAQPRVDDRGWQEYYKGHAQDRYEILGLTTKVRTPAAASNAAMLTQETTPLEPGVVDHKVYVRGVGTVAEETVKGGHERFRLVSIRRR